MSFVSFANNYLFSKYGPQSVSFKIAFINWLIVMQCASHKLFRIWLHCPNSFSVLFHHVRHLLETITNTLGATRGAGIAYPPGTSAFTTFYRLCSSLVFVFCKLNVVLSLICFGHVLLFVSLYFDLQYVYHVLVSSVSLFILYLYMIKYFISDFTIDIEFSI